MKMQKRNYIEGMSRSQLILLPDMLDDYVDEENEVRFIDAFVDALDLIGLGFTHSEPSDEGGRPSYDPRDMLKLYVWGYLNQVRSSRKLERECHRNMEVAWLMKKLAPDFKTIANFRKNNVDRIKSVFKEFVSFLQDIDLIEGKLASLDGSKIKACNGRKRNFTKEGLALKLKRIEERVDRYMKELEQNDGLDDRDEDDDDDEDDKELIKKRNDYLRAKLEKLKKSKRELDEVRRKMEETGKDEISLTDPESRLMKNNGKIEVCYNAEMSVDAKEHIIVNYDVINETNDEQQLAPMSKDTKEVLDVEKLDVTTDTGFVNMAQIKDCVDNGITPYLPKAKLDGSKTGGGNVPDPVSFGKDKFAYEKDRDLYVCPAGNELTLRQIKTSKGGKNTRVYSTDACKACPFKARCTGGNSRRRTVTRWEHQDIIDELLKRTRQEPEKLEARSKLAEHPFGTIKRAFNQGYFLLKGLRKVRGEMGFTMLAYDMRRALNILGTRHLLQALARLTERTVGAMK
ncbi:MAG: IS1182 family transposase [Thaumarchaeota archaeon]|nr:IS1182 family transposase [Nitrososphaerota archaeon]